MDHVDIVRQLHRLDKRLMYDREIEFIERQYDRVIIVGRPLSPTAEQWANSLLEDIPLRATVIAKRL